jgi:hypothetical protein
MEELHADQVDKRQVWFGGLRVPFNENVCRFEVAVGQGPIVQGA